MKHIGIALIYIGFFALIGFALWVTKSLAVLFFLFLPLTIKNQTDMRHQESVIQQTCVRWFRMQYPQLAMLLFAVPNGGARLRSEAAIMKAEGTMKGVADLLLLFPAKKYHGLCIEMKTPTGRQQPSQKAWQERAEWAGYKYVICRSFDEFMAEIDAYLK